MRKIIFLILGIFLAPSYVIAVGLVNESGLLFYESFNDSNSIYNNNGTITGAVRFSQGIVGNAFNFTGGKRKCISYNTLKKMLAVLILKSDESHRRAVSRIS